MIYVLMWRVLPYKVQMTDNTNCPVGKVTSGAVALERCVFCVCVCASVHVKERARERGGGNV